MRKKLTSKSIFAIFILFIMFLMWIFNIREFFTLLNNNVTIDTINNNENIFSEIEDTFRAEIKNRNELVNLYGVSQKILGRRIVGNFEYVADEEGVLHMINDYMPYFSIIFVDEMKKLNSILEEKGTPLLYIQAPSKEVSGETPGIDALNLDDETMDTVVAELGECGIEIMDFRTDKYLDEFPYELSDMYFHTDLHMQTDSEIWMAQQVVEKLQNDYDLVFNNTEYLYDMNYYDLMEYDFIGNYGRTNGDYFVDSDIFKAYYPKFQTAYTYERPQQDYVSDIGTFEDVVLNQMEQKEYDSHTYWVTNFMKFTDPYYSIRNHNQEQTSILFITDSIAYRALAYMSTTLHKITVVDPRYFNGDNIVKQALEREEYDIVVVWQANYLMGFPFGLE